MPALHVGGVATSAVEVVVGVRWFGMKIGDQTVPVAYYFCIEERDGLPILLDGKFDGRVICVNIVYKFYQFFPRPVSRRQICRLFMYLHQMIGFTLCVD